MKANGDGDQNGRAQRHPRHGGVSARAGGRGGSAPLIRRRGPLYHPGKDRDDDGRVPRLLPAAGFLHAGGMERWNANGFRPADLILLAAAAAVCLALLFWAAQHGRRGTCTAVIEQDGQELRRIFAFRAHRREGTDRTRRRVSCGAAGRTGGNLRFSPRDCPDQICVHTGKLTKPGQAAVCLPAPHFRPPGGKKRKRRRRDDRMNKREKGGTMHHGTRSAAPPGGRHGTSGRAGACSLPAGERAAACDGAAARRKAGPFQHCRAVCRAVSGGFPAVCVALVKGVFAGLTRGGAAFIMSTSGGLLSTAVMTLFSRSKRPSFGLLGLGVAGGVAHNLGQLLAACLITTQGGGLVCSPSDWIWRSVRRRDRHHPACHDAGHQAPASPVCRSNGRRPAHAPTAPAKAAGRGNRMEVKRKWDCHFLKNRSAPTAVRRFPTGKTRAAADSCAALPGSGHDPHAAACGCALQAACQGRGHGGMWARKSATATPMSARRSMQAFPAR